MAKKLSENPAGGPEMSREPATDPIADPVLEQMAAARKGQPNSQPIFYQRGISGRDGTGDYIVKDKGAVMMPNGDYAKPGDTFSQAAEGFNDAQMRHLLGSGFVDSNPHKAEIPGRKPVVTKIEQPKVVKSAERGPDTASC